MCISRRFLLTAVLLLSSVAPAAAQYQAPTKPWGIIASVAPWRADDRFKALYDASALDMRGADLRIGVTRGGALGNEWAVMFTRRTISDSSTLRTLRGQGFQFQPGVKLTGFMAEQFGAFGTIANRVQIGGLIGGGLARAEGTAIATPQNIEVAAGDVLTLFARQVDFQLLMRAELAVGIKVAPGTKIRFSGGFDWPGITTVSVSALYFFGDR